MTSVSDVSASVRMYFSIGDRVFIEKGNVLDASVTSVQWSNWTVVRKLETTGTLLTAVGGACATVRCDDSLAVAHISIAHKT